MFSAIVITAPPLGLSSTSSASTPPPQRSGSAASALISAAPNHLATAVRPIAGGLAWKSSSTWKSWGLLGTVVKSTKGQSIDYDVAISLQLPMAWWFGSHVLKGQLNVSFPRQNTLTLRHPSYLAIARVLDFSHPFFEACRSNDFTVVREMLRNGEGRPTDEDPGGSGPLWVRVGQTYFWLICQLMLMQYAVAHSNVEVLAELLENGANVEARLSHSQVTLLEIAAFQRHLDVLRVLLRRGASTDHCNEDGIDVQFFCWCSEDHSNKGISATETANVLSEYVALDPQATWDDSTILHIAAACADGHDIDALISCGHDVEAKDDDNLTPIACAVQYGNASAYFALLAHGADLNYSWSSVEEMLHRAMTCQAQMPNLTFLPFPEEADYESIVRHILKHGSPDLNIAIRVRLGDEDYPPSVHGHSTTPRQLAEACGPKIEAWFLTLLLESGHPDYFTKRDKRRLHALRLEEYAPQGCVLGDDDNLSEDDDTHQSGDRTNEDHGDDDGYVYHHLYDHGDDASSIHEDTNDEGAEEQFWDAAQDL